MDIDNVQAFVNKLIEEKNITDVEPEVLEQMKKDLLERVEKRVDAVVIEQLSPEQLAEFEKLLDGSDESTLKNFCQNAIPNLNELIAAELLNFRTTYLGIG